jgi:hypothetical protein
MAHQQKLSGLPTKDDRSREQEWSELVLLSP